MGAYTVAVLSSEHAQPVRGSWCVPIAIAVAMVSGVHPRRPDAARARRLPRHRHARLRRDRAPEARQLAVARRRAGHLRHPAAPGIELFEVPSIDWSSGVAGRRPRHDATFLKFGINDFDPVLLAGAHRHRPRAALRILVKNSRVGRAWEATREDEDAAELMGVPTFRFKLLAFAIGAAIGGLSGCALRRRKSGVHQPRASSCSCRSSSSRPSSSAARATAGASSSARSWSATSRSGSVTFADFRVLVFGLAADAARDLPAPGPAAAAAHGPRQASRCQTAASRKEAAKRPARRVDADALSRRRAPRQRRRHPRGHRPGRRRG